LSKIANVLGKQNKFKEALDRYNESLIIKEKVTGEKSNDVINTRISIGIFYEKQNKF
jgi:hypothetical protein